jgi:hypothetical protein
LVGANGKMRLDFIDALRMTIVAFVIVHHAVDQASRPSNARFAPKPN